MSKKNAQSTAYNPVRELGLRLFLTPDADLALALAAVIITLLVLFIPYSEASVLRTIAGSIFLFLVPGYTLVAAIYPKKDEISDMERITFSLCLSIAVACLVGLLLNYTPWGIQLKPVSACLAIFSLAAVGAALRRRSALPHEQRFGVSFVGTAHLPRATLPQSEKRVGKVLTVAVIASALLWAGTFAYLVVIPKLGPPFTEFYILGPNGQAEDYPTNFTLGQQKPVIVGIVNQEQKNATYTVVATFNNSGNTTELYSNNVTVGDGQRWQETVLLSPNARASNATIEFLLFIDGQLASPYREASLKVSVT